MIKNNNINISHKIPVKIYFQRITDCSCKWNNGIKFIMVLKGSLQFWSLYTKSITVEEGEIKIINPHQLHCISPLTSNNIVLILEIDSDFVRSYFTNNFVQVKNPNFNIRCLLFNCEENVISPFNADTNRYEQLKLQIISLTNSIYFSYNLDRCEELANSLLFNLFNNFCIFTKKSLKKSNRLKYSTRFMNIFIYMADNFLNKIELSEIAKYERLNADYLSRQIKELVGYNWVKCINFLRIEHSLKLLMTTDMNITEIAFSSGFSSPRYYYKNFYYFFPEGPAKFRKKYKPLCSFAKISASFRKINCKNKRD
jgi:AraC-like DNA-binding protein